MPPEAATLSACKGSDLQTLSACKGSDLQLQQGSATLSASRGPRMLIIRFRVRPKCLTKGFPGEGDSAVPGLLESSEELSKLSSNLPVLPF